MSGKLYKRLAVLLDAFPNGYPATESGIEIRLLEKVFTPEQAKVALHMKGFGLVASAIATKAAMEKQETKAILRSMARDGLIRMSREREGLGYALIPFVVGFYEEQLHRIDRELAELVEEYLTETQGGAIAVATPGIHRVVPVEEAIPNEIEVFPFEKASQILDGAKSWAVRDCICTVQRSLIEKACDRPVETCIVFSGHENAFANSKVDRALTKDEAIEILRVSEDAGLVHSTGNYRDGRNYICNCCSCCCGVLRTLTEFGVPTAMAHSDFRCAVDPDLCIGCEACLEECKFEALSMNEFVVEIENSKCLGCGLCISSCPEEALALERRPEEDLLPLPANQLDWMQQRADNRNISVDIIF